LKTSSARSTLSSAFVGTARTWRGRRRDQTVCAVCEPTVRDAGWVRVVDSHEQVRVTGLTRTVRRVA
jgi:hypothetical protein